MGAYDQANLRVCPCVFFKDINIYAHVHTQGNKGGQGGGKYIDWHMLEN